jgi:hypothetical protein
LATLASQKNQPVRPADVIAHKALAN